MTRSAESDWIESLSDYIRKLNQEKESLVIVEGVRDARALRDAGFHGEVFMLCHHAKTIKLEQLAPKFKKTIFLLDNDAEGKKLVERTKRMLDGKVKIDLYYQRGLLPASRGKIRHVEELSQYAENVALAVARV